MTQTTRFSSSGLGPHSPSSTMWNMRVRVIPIVVSALEKIPQSLERGLENWKSEK